MLQGGQVTLTAQKDLLQPRLTGAQLLGGAGGGDGYFRNTVGNFLKHIYIII